MAYVTMIGQWGNSAAVRIRASTLSEANLKVGDCEEIEASPARIFLRTKERRPRPTLQDMIAACNPTAPMPDDLANWN